MLGAKLSIAEFTRPFCTTLRPKLCIVTPSFNLSLTPDGLRTRRVRLYQSFHGLKLDSTGTVSTLKDLLKKQHLTQMDKRIKFVDGWVLFHPQLLLMFNSDSVLDMPCTWIPQWSAAIIRTQHATRQKLSQKSILLMLQLVTQLVAKLLQSEDMGSVRKILQLWSMASLARSLRQTSAILSARLEQIFLPHKT